MKNMRAGATECSERRCLLLQHGACSAFIKASSMELAGASVKQSCSLGQT